MKEAELRRRLKSAKSAEEALAILDAEGLLSGATPEARQSENPNTAAAHDGLRRTAKGHLRQILKDPAKCAAFIKAAEAAAAPCLLAWYLHGHPGEVATPDGFKEAATMLARQRSVAAFKKALSEIERTWQRLERPDQLSLKAEGEDGAGYQAPRLADQFPAVLATMKTATEKAWPGARARGRKADAPAHYLIRTLWDSVKPATKAETSALYKAIGVVFSELGREPPSEKQIRASLNGHTAT